jgi:hypothetical protein
MQGTKKETEEDTLAEEDTLDTLADTRCTIESKPETQE